MGNPAGEKRKKREKRRKKYETRLGPGVYLPKEQRETVNAEVAKMEAERKAQAEKRKQELAAKKAPPASAATKA